MKDRRKEAAIEERSDEKNKVEKGEREEGQGRNEGLRKDGDEVRRMTVTSAGTQGIENKKKEV